MLSLSYKLKYNKMEHITLMEKRIGAEWLRCGLPK